MDPTDPKTERVKVIVKCSPLTTAEREFKKGETYKEQMEFRIAEEYKDWKKTVLVET